MYPEHAKRKKEALKALKDLGGEATIGEIAKYLGLKKESISQTLLTLKQKVDFLGGKGKEERYRLVNRP